MEPLLDEDETARWQAWKRANDAVTAAVAHEIQAASGLSVADFSVLSRVVEEGGGRLGQQELADMLGWQRARLSRQLERMAERGLLDRPKDAGNRRGVVATEAGRETLGRARPAHARAVREYLLGSVADNHRAIFWAALTDLSAGWSR